MTRSSVSILSIICLAWLVNRTCGAQLAFTSVGNVAAVATAAGLSVVAQVPGLRALNGILHGFNNNNNHNNNFYPQQQQQGVGGWQGMGGQPRHGHGMGGRWSSSVANAARQPAPPGWPPGWEWGGGGNNNQQGFNNGRAPPGWPPGWEWGGGGNNNQQGFNNGRGPPPRPGWGAGPGPMNPPPRPEWGGGGTGPPPRPEWGGGAMGPPPRPEWGDGGEMNPLTGSDYNQPNPTDVSTNWDNPNGEGSTIPPSPIVTPPTTPKPVVVEPTFQPRPPAQTTESTLIVGTNRPPLLPPQTTPLPPPLPTVRPLPPRSRHSIEASQLRDIIFPSSSLYIHRPQASQEIRTDNIDERR
ncbi:RNA-binding protein 12 [Drosophila obscura]|uniref:RNA-binding protein 12 n=1 Tax=Drosophila obscura TaxID=7282 RepID=UPI001BB21B41|nr:RNA-binding protein 12 [Drosophila obscura]